MMITDTSLHRKDGETRSIDAATALKAASMRQDFLLDEALKETFPASDPISMAQIT